MDLSKYTILLCVTSFSVGSIITSLLHLYFFKRTMKKMKRTNQVQSDTIKNLLSIDENENIKVIGKNF